jgi:hypothetical protein
MNKKKYCESANFSHFKQSDKRKLSAEAKILIALMHAQPLKRNDLIKQAKVDPSTFSRIRRLLIKHQAIKRTSNGFCLFNHIEHDTLWDRVKQACFNAGGSSTDVTLKKLVLGEQHPITGHYETSYDENIIQGIMIHKGAIELKAAASEFVPISGNYSAFLLTQACFYEGDRLLWKDMLFEVKDYEEIFNGIESSFRIGKLVSIPK